MSDPSASTSTSGPQASTSSSSLPDRSIFGTDPLDEFICFIGGWIYNITNGGSVLNNLPHGSTSAEIEVEAKIGTLVDAVTRQRIHLPVVNETIVNTEQYPNGIRFESGMTSSQHKHFNKLLNSLVMSAQQDKSRPSVTYKRYQEIDYFFGSRSTGGGEKIRVTKDQESFTTKPGGSVIKKRLGNLEVYCPNRAFDYRISVNLEIQTPEPEASIQADFHREKNRMSYTHTGLRVDLTLVKSSNANSGEEETQHELEVEMLQAPLGLLTAQSSSLASSQNRSLNGQAGGQDWTEYEDEVMRFVNDVRLLIRNAQWPDPK
ncbi:unnamed protein product [Sympodiomycopsis kandeliae]